MIIKELDWSWYWLGYTIGVNSKKKGIENAERIENQGVQGLITVPTEQQKTSFFIGLLTGRRKIISSMNQVIVKTTQTKKPSRFGGKLIELAVGEKQGIRGQYVDIPLYINNNRADNRGLIGFQSELEYDTTKLELVSVAKSETWTGTLDTNVVSTFSNSNTGVIRAYGFKDVMDKDDVVIYNARFRVKDTVEEDVGEIPLILQGVAGTGLGSELLTKINEENYYITPISLKSGGVLLDAKPKNPNGSVIIPNFGQTTVGTGNSSVSYDFTATVELPSGLTGGVSAVINTYIDGVLIGSERVPLKTGTNTYKGKIPLKVPAFKKGNITYEIVIEPDNAEDEGIHYVFIKAGAMFILETEIKRNEVGLIEHEIVRNKEIVDIMLEIKDYVDIEIFKATKGGVDLDIREIIQIIDNAVINKNKQKDKSSKDNITISDNALFTISKK